MGYEARAEQEPAHIKLNAQVASQVRRLRGEGHTLASIARQTGVAEVSVKAIMYKGQWADQTEAPQRNCLSLQR